MEKLTIESLPQIDDGAVAIAINQEIVKVYHDCRDRPHLKKPRTVTIVLKFTPDPDPQQAGSELERATFSVEVGSSLPKKGLAQIVKVSPKVSGFSFFTDEDGDGQKALPFNESDDE